MKAVTPELIAEYIEGLRARSRNPPKDDTELQLQEISLALWTIALLLSRGVGQIYLTAPEATSSRDAIKELQRNEILAALNACQWNRKEAAAKIGVCYKTFLNRMREFGLKKKLETSDGNG